MENIQEAKRRPERAGRRERWSIVGAVLSAIDAQPPALTERDSPPSRAEPTSPTTGCKDTS